ncbi:ABC transporter permease [Sphingomonas chungangi]|uniref:ABC transporter permease n=1 Tax=Sphingomonas chungangi TaxID=2683589 RepID=UPI0031B5FE3E
MTTKRDVLQARWLSPVALLLLWELASRTGVIPDHILAAPSSVVRSLFGMTASGELPLNLAVSLRRAALGFAIGSSLGVVLALAAGLLRRGDALIDPIIQIKRTLPVVALTPLFIIWFGIGETTKIALIAFASMLPVYINLHQGIRGIDIRLVDAARSFGLGRAALIGNVILPGALPSLLTGLRYSLSISVLMLVIAEQVNASAGLGFMIQNARDAMRTDIIVVCLMVYALLGLAGDSLIRAIESKALAWRPTLVEA